MQFQQRITVKEMLAKDPFECSNPFRPKGRRVMQHGFLGFLPNPTAMRKILSLLRVPVECTRLRRCDEPPERPHGRADAGDGCVGSALPAYPLGGRDRVFAAQTRGHVRVAKKGEAGFLTMILATSLQVALADACACVLGRSSRAQGCSHCCARGATAPWPIARARRRAHLGGARGVDSDTHCPQIFFRFLAPGAKRQTGTARFARRPPGRPQRRQPRLRCEPAQSSRRNSVRAPFTEAALRRPARACRRETGSRRSRCPTAEPGSYPSDPP